MAVREFDGSDDNINLGVDVLSGMTFGTFAAIFKSTTTASADKWIAALHTSGGTFRVALLGCNTAPGATERVSLYHAGEGATTTNNATVIANRWILCVVRKATGTVAPRFSIFDYSDTSWTHENGNTTRSNWTSPGAGGTVRTSVGGSEFFQGRLAVSAAWANAVHWSADTTGDTAIEGAGLEDSLQNWVDETPDTLWAFNQDPLSAVNDLIANADQTAVVGTTVVTGDDPPGFSFTLGGGAVLMPRGVIVAG